MKSGGIIYFDLNKKGTNGHKRHVHSMTILGVTLKTSNWILIAIVLLLLALAAMVILPHKIKDEQISMLMKGYKVYAAVPEVTPAVIQETDQQKEIADYIREVFGKDADLAFQVLSCENSALRPDAVNTAGNSPAGSRDIGIFQINEYWQRTQGKFLFNWKVNIEIAHQLFEENGKSFKLWTCGRKLGI